LQADIQAPEETEVTATFTETPQEQAMWVSNADPEISQVDSTEDLPLESFLARPVTIVSYSWTTSDPVGVLGSFRPWQLFMNTPTVRNKLNNFAFFRGKLHLKVVINGTPFQYGCLRLAYRPLVGLIRDSIRTNTTSDLPLRVPYSQTPGFYIDPSANQGGEMELPFFYHKNWLDITSNTDVDNFGLASLIVYAPLNIALTTASTAVSVRVVAWATDVELMGATSKFALQSDEYGKGAISGPASAVAGVAGMLTKIPVIGSFARATQIGASAVSSIASIFGFTNPPNISDVQPIYQMSAPHLATSDISVPYQKLTLDPKTELAIDPCPFSLPNVDELSINHLKKKESFFGYTTWSTTQNVNSSLFYMRVTPSIRDLVTLNNVGVKGYRHYDTPLSYMANVFQHWRGSLKIRFKVVCTKYHKGRIKIQWDPVNNIFTDNPDLNTAYTHILDLGESTEVTLEIPYHQATAWLSTASTAGENGWRLGTNIAPVPGWDNGMLGIRVYNILEAPSTPSTVTILAYISAGDDFEFSNPRSNITVDDTVPTPSFFALQSDIDECDPCLYQLQSDTSTYHCFGTRGKPSDHRYDMNFGEAVLSLRKLLRRSQIVDTVPLPTGTVSATNIYRKGLFRIPYTPGYVPYSWSTQANRVLAGGTANYAFNNMHMIPYITGMFLGTRGGVNYTLTASCPQAQLNDIRITRVTDSSAITPTNRLVQLMTSIAGAATLSSKVANLGVIWNKRDGLAGMALSSAVIAPTVQFTIPDNNNYNFTLSDPDHWLEGDAADGTNAQGALVTITVANSTANDEVGYTTLLTSAGIGTDFTCLFFLCCPTLDYLLNDPTPV